MPTAFLEIIELENGDVALQKTEGDEKQLVTIHFSEEAKEMLQGEHVHVAKGMFQAGLQIVGRMQEEAAEMEEAPKVVH
ncbi:hypothetical protein ACFOEK_01255 [Litoribrevibacter euphylliae]|uniref:Uncharacterized protein n=1 Tax=Litoribrevibacter euphylliae TaxID=1834034 RepID=A0ABV7HAT7_9GAMM